MHAVTMKSYEFLPIAMRHHPGNMGADRSRKHPQPKSQRRKTTMHAITIKSYEFLPIALRHHPGNMDADRIKQSPA